MPRRSSRRKIIITLGGDRVVFFPFNLNPDIVDITGRHIGAILGAAAAKWGIPLVLLLTAGNAESHLNPGAISNGGWPDIAVGPFQQTARYAVDCDTPETCRAAFVDWNLSADVAAQELSIGYTSAKDLNFTGDDLILAALSQYNSGQIQEAGNWWWRGRGCASYRKALTLARDQLLQ
jgi:hypothetical protein